MSNENFAYEYEPFYTEQNFTGLGRRFTPPPARAQLAPQDVGWVLVAASKLHSISYLLPDINVLCHILILNNYPAPPDLTKADPVKTLNYVFEDH